MYWGIPVCVVPRRLNRRREVVSVVAIGRDAESTLIVNRADCPSAGGVQTSSTKAVIPGPGPGGALPKTIIHSTSPRSQGRVSHHVTTYCEDLSAREKPAGLSSTFHAGKSSGSILSRPLRVPFPQCSFLACWLLSFALLATPLPLSSTHIHPCTSLTESPDTEDSINTTIPRDLRADSTILCHPRILSRTLHQGQRITLRDYSLAKPWD